MYFLSILHFYTLFRRQGACSTFAIFFTIWNILIIKLKLILTLPFFYSFNNSPDSQVKSSLYNRYFRYLKALSDGRQSGSVSASQQQQHQHQHNDLEAGPATCDRIYASCPNDISQSINLGVLRVMQYLVRKFKIRFDETA